MTRPHSALQVGIVDGGIAGVALVLDLCRHPHLQVTLFEAACAFGEVVAGYLGASLAPGVGQPSVHRTDFLDALAQQLPEGIARFDKRAVGAEETGDRVCVRFTDGTDYECDLLIAADGIKSSLRDYVLQGLGKPAVAPRFSGTCAYRGMIDSEQLRAAYRSAGVDEHLINVPQMYLGLDAHILTFPVKRGRLINVVAFISDRSEPNPVWPPGTPWVKSSSQAQMLDAFAQWDDAVRVLLGCTPEPTLWHHDLQSDLIAARAQLGWAACE